MLIVCDIDGTIADCSHRVPLIPDWDAFNELMYLDDPIEPVILLLKHLLNVPYDSLCPPPVKLVFLTGRPERYRPVTARWLMDHCNLAEHDDYDLLMRPDDVFESDVLLKPKLLEEYVTPAGEELLAKQAIFIDDRDKVVAMWRGRGYCCLQPQEGAF